MKVTIVSVVALALVAWCAPGFAAPAAEAGHQISASHSYQVAQNDNHYRHPDRDDNYAHPDHDHFDEWYQGQRGRWERNGNHWDWRGTGGDDWYMGQRGHWYREPNGWQFGSSGLICNNDGRNCRHGGYLAANGEGMVSRRNPRLFWHCDSEGHNCHWARRPGF